jgi:hypothetical protein
MNAGCLSYGGCRASETNKSTILLVFWPVFGVAPSGEYPDMPRFNIRRNSGQFIFPAAQKDPNPNIKVRTVFYSNKIDRIPSFGI